MLPVVRRDKYERDVREYWIDVRTTGEMKQLMSELVIRTIEVAGDFDHPMPAPMLGDGPTPEVPGFATSGAYEVFESDPETAGESKGKGKSKGGKGKSKSDYEAYLAHRKQQAAQDAAIEEVYEDSHESYM